MASLASLTLLGTAALFLCACADDQPAHADLSVAEKHAFLEGLVPDLLEAIERRDTPEAVFHGCYDWHSAVHAHWAILRIDMATGNQREAAERVAARLSVEGVERELFRLQADKAFEFPYGRAWFLRLAIDYEKWAAARERADGDRLRHAAKRVYLSLTEGLRGKADATTHEYANVEWALIQMRAWEELRGAKIRYTGVERASVDVAGLAADHDLPEFFSPVGNWLYLEARHGRLPLTLLTETDLTPMRWPDDRPPRAHAYGMNWSRAWAFAAVVRASNNPAVEARFSRAYQDHIRVGMRVHTLAKGDYDNYDHWVPQFAVYALTPEFN